MRIPDRLFQEWIQEKRDVRKAKTAQGEWIQIFDHHENCPACGEWDGVLRLLWCDKCQQSKLVLRQGVEQHTGAPQQKHLLHANLQREGPAVFLPIDG